MSRKYKLILLFACVCAESLQLCLAPCDPMDCCPPGSSIQRFSRQEYWSGQSYTFPGDLPDPGIEPVSPAGGFFTAESLEKLNLLFRYAKQACFQRKHTDGFLGGSDGKDCLQCRIKPGFDPWIKKIPWRREWLLTLVSLPE